MKYRDGYVVVSEPDGVVWQGRSKRPAAVPSEPFEATFAQGRDWVEYQMPKQTSGSVRVCGVLFIAATLREVWLWVAAGEPCAVAPVAFGEVRGIAMKSHDGRIAVVAQCEERK